MSSHGDEPLVLDGLAGPRTVEATKAYQRAMDLVPDGIAGPLTRAAIDNESCAREDFWEMIPHFVREEFSCKCGRCGGFPAEPDKKLVRLAVLLAVQLKPISISLLPLKLTKFPLFLTGKKGEQINGYF